MRDHDACGTEDEEADLLVDDKSIRHGEWPRVPIRDYIATIIIGHCGIGQSHYAKKKLEQKLLRNV